MSSTALLEHYGVESGANPHVYTLSITLYCYTATLLHCTRWTPGALLGSKVAPDHYWGAPPMTHHSLLRRLVRRHSQLKKQARPQHALSTYGARPHPINQTRALSNQTRALSPQTWALSNQTRALSNQTRALPNQMRALSNQTRALPNQTRAFLNQTRALSIRRGARVSRLLRARLVGLASLGGQLSAEWHRSAC